MNHKMVQADTSGEKTPAFNIVDCASNILVIITPEIGEGRPVFDSYFSKKMARPLTSTVLEFISANHLALVSHQNFCGIFPWINPPEN